jgi:PhzF family phenazine biosynthesis protein
MSRRPRRFAQVDVFAHAPCAGNPVAVVLDSEGLETEEMQRFARWMNLSETTFVSAPTADGADYAVRIFTPVAELPFAGHPTLGTCHAWLAQAQRPADAPDVVQECGAGLVPVRFRDGRLAFEAPPLIRSGPVEADIRAEILRALGLLEHDLVDAAWVDNGPGWVAVLLRSAEEVLRLRPSFSELDIGVAGPCPAGDEAALEVRAFFPVGGAVVEDPATGSLNASLAQWLLERGRISAPYVARQGTALGRQARVHVDVDAGGMVWVGGATTTLVEGFLTL